MATDQREYNRQYRLKNQARIKEQRASYRASRKYQEWLAGTKEHRTARETAKARVRRQSSLTAWFKHLLAQARSRKWECALTLDDLQAMWDTQAGLCKVSGLPMDHAVHSLSSVSIDRIESSGDYTRENTHLVARWVNIAKGDRPLGEIVAIVEALKASRS